MAVTLDSYDNALVLDGFEQGIADDPYTGISNMRNVNITTVPGEASVNFSTILDSSPKITGAVVTGLSSSTLTFTGGSGLENGMAIYFTAVGGLTGVSINTTYWLQNVSGSPATSAKLFSDYNLSSPVTITGTATSSPTFTAYSVGYSQYSGVGAPAYGVFGGTYGYFMQDSVGQVWTTNKTTGTNNYWVFTGITGTSDINVGRGLVFLQGSDGVGWIFSFNSYSVDYFNCTTGVWTWGWNPNDGSINNLIGAFELKGLTNHFAIWAPDGTVYFCNGNWVSTFFQTLPTTPFDPTNTATYTFAEFELLPIDTAQCLTFLGNTILIGGKKNIVYVWDRFSPLPNNYILLPENNVVRMVTVNTNSFLFVGNRGRIYITNGTNAQLYKKVPDHISGTLTPYYTWGDATFQKNQLYFSFLVNANPTIAQSPLGPFINQYGGVWAIDLDTEALRLTNELSYGAYSGYASVIIAQMTNGSGDALFFGWDKGNNTFVFGIDQTTNTPYVSSQTTIDFDLIPIGTFNKPRDMSQIEYRLTRPLVSGESIVVKTRLIFDTSDTGFTTTLTDSTVGSYSGTAPVNFLNAQWLQIQVVLNSTATNPSYTRLRQIRIMGLVGPTLATNQQLEI